MEERKTTITVWVCGKWINELPGWEIQGVFDDEKLAYDYAKVFDDYFIGPIVLNKPFPRESIEWVGCYYPCLAQNKQFPTKS